MNLSDFSETQRQRAAEWACAKVSIEPSDAPHDLTRGRRYYCRRDGCDFSMATGGGCITKPCASALLESTDSAMKAVEKLPKSCNFTFGGYSFSLGTGTGEIDGTVLLSDFRKGRVDPVEIRFRFWKDRAAAITLCVALALGFKVEEKK